MAFPFSFLDFRLPAAGDRTATPAHDPALLVDDEVTIAVQHKGKLRDTLTVAKGLGQEELQALALASEKVQRSLDGAEVRKVIPRFIQPGGWRKITPEEYRALLAAMGL